MQFEYLSVKALVEKIQRQVDEHGDYRFARAAKGVKVLSAGWNKDAELYDDHRRVREGRRGPFYDPIRTINRPRSYLGPHGVFVSTRPYSKVHSNPNEAHRNLDRVPEAMGVMVAIPPRIKRSALIRVLETAEVRDLFAFERTLEIERVRALGLAVSKLLQQEATPFVRRRLLR